MRRYIASMLAAMLAAGLAPAATAAPPSSAAAAPPLSVHGLWRIDQARVEPMLDRRQARLDFGPDGRLSGHTSCNTLTASYTLEGDQLKIGPVATTRMTCSPLLLEQEDRVLTALELATTAKVRDDGLLELRDADGRGVLRGTRFEPEAAPAKKASSNRSSPAPAGRSAAASAVR